MATSTTTTINDTILAAVIDPVAQDYVHDWTVVTPFLKPYSLIGRGSNTYQIYRFASAMGTVSDGGTGVDAEFDWTETQDITSTTLSTDQVQITLTEYGVMRELTDYVQEDSLGGIDFVGQVLSDAARILTTAFEDDVCALFASLSNSVGSSGTDMSLANMNAALTGTRNRGVRAPDNGVFILDDEQALNWEDALIAIGSAANYDLAADRLMRTSNDASNGLTNGRIGSYRGCEIYQTGLTDTANTGADVVGAFFIHNTPANSPFACFGMVTGRNFRMETDRDISLRTTQFVATARWGSAELDDNAGTNITTDAPA